MKENERREIDERYKQKKAKGVLFFPDLLYKDAVIGLLVFLVLVGAAYFIGAPLEERANPADTSYTPKPEWYFLFLFQLLKYFPGSLEVIGVFVLPTLAILLLVALPFLDRSPKRNPRNRPLWVGITAVFSIGVIVLTVLAFVEAPPPAEVAQGDRTAALYVENCAPCHGPSINVDPGTNLHSLIAQGKHEGMPAWSGDLTTDEIDSLAGFILSPDGSQLFTDNCSACHQVSELVSTDPLELKRAIEDGQAFPAHEGLDPGDALDLSSEERTALLNFLVAPDGQRLFAVNCAPCHGRSVAFSGDAAGLETLIRQGGLHLEMPPWRGTLSGDELDALAEYVVQPGSAGDGEVLFGTYCAECHGDRIPRAADVTTAREIIAAGGSHETMPVWGEILTAEQIAALVTYTESAASGLPTELGQEIYAQNCAVCHGDFGEGGANPARPGDIIAPISTSEYLKTRDDLTLRSVITQGQPNFGMAPFGNAFGGPLQDEEIDAVVAFMRSWEANPPVELPPEVTTTASPPLSGAEIYAGLCSQCHGQAGEGGIGPSLSDPGFQARNSDEQVFRSIDLGHPATPMIAWGEILTSEQIDQVVTYIRSLAEPADDCELEGLTTFEKDIRPIFERECISCHGSLGGWDSSTFEGVMTSGNNAPVVIPGDAAGSLLVQKVLGTQSSGAIMPPSGMLPGSEVQTILEWVGDGAVEEETCDTEAPRFSIDVKPLLDASCVACHGTLGGWDGSTFESVMTSGNNAPVVIPGDAAGSLLVQKLLGTQSRGAIMPPSGMLPDSEIEVFVDWINAGAQDD
jgi:mono/diheme cytochrome c family protein